MIEADDKLVDGITFRNVLILTTCVRKDDDKFYAQLYLEEALIGIKNNLIDFNIDMYLTIDSVIDDKIWLELVGIILL